MLITFAARFETMLKQWQAVFFDLDGCLIDTAPDMGAAINRILIKEGREPLPMESIRPHVSYGAKALVRLGFGNHLPTEKEDTLTRDFLNDYAKHIADESTLFPGLTETLDELAQAQIPWGIVTNKPGYLTIPLVKQLQPTITPDCIVSGDTLTVRKPDPGPVLYAAKQLKVNPVKCVYLGDAQRDITAGNKAGMHTLATAYGYILDSDDITDWQADQIISQASEILPWLKVNNPN